jgi:hypothetical protein
VRAGRARSLEGILRASPQHAVFGDERPVEIEREGADAAREVRGQLDGYGALPPIESTT